MATQTHSSFAALRLDRRATRDVFNMATPLVDRHVAEGRGNRPALRLDTGDITYSELQDLVNRAGNALLEAGVQPEQRVALLLHDGPEFVATFIGAMKIGAVPLPLNTGAPTADLLYYLGNSRSRALVAHAGLAERLLARAEDPALRVLAAALVVGSEGALANAGRIRVQRYDEATGAASPRLETFPTGADEPSYWLYSSGTTGRPKGTVHLHGDMLACIAPFCEEVVGITPDDVTFSVARLFFSYGLGNSLYVPLLAGASVALTPDRPEPRRILQVVRQHRPTLFFSVPTGYTQLCAALEAGENADRPFDGVRLAVSAGEPLPAPLYERWLGLTGVETLDGIGSTEVGYIYCCNLPGQVRPGASGRMIGGHESRVVGEDGQDVPVGESGELWVKAASTALCYWNQRERTKQTFVGEWIRTGDRYRQDADGFFWYLGRMGDVFKVSGQWVSPMEVESCLLEHPAVFECAVVGQVDADGLVKTKAYIVRRPDVGVTAAELQTFVKSRLQPHKYPRTVEFVEQLPKTATGKVQRFRLRQEGE